MENTTTKFYKTRYRWLKSYFESKLGRKISDQYWYKICSQIKKENPTLSIYSKDFTLKIDSIFEFRKVFPRFRVESFRSPLIQEVYTYFLKLKNPLTTDEFFNELEKFLDISQVTKKTKYEWFTRVGISVKDGKHEPQKLALVSVHAAKCSKVKSVKPQLTTTNV